MVCQGRSANWLLPGSWMASNSAHAHVPGQKQARRAKEALKLRSTAGRHPHVVTIKNSFPASHGREWEGVNLLLQHCLDALVH